MLGMLGYLAQLSLMAAQEPAPMGSAHSQIVPYGSFPTADGHILIACLTPQFWDKLCQALGPDTLAQDKRFTTMELRRDNREALDAIISDITRTRPTAEWQALFDAADVPCGPVLGIGAALAQPQAQARGMLQTIEHPTLGALPLVGRPVKFPGASQPPLRPPPLLGPAHGGDPARRTWLFRSPDHRAMRGRRGAGAAVGRPAPGAVLRSRKFAAGLFQWHERVLAGDGGDRLIEVPAMPRLGAGFDAPDMYRVQHVAVRPQRHVVVGEIVHRHGAHVRRDHVGRLPTTCTARIQ